MVTFDRIAMALALTCFFMLGLPCHGQRLSAGNFHSLKICTDSSAMAWGQNPESELGTAALQYAEVPIGVNLDRLIAIDGGVGHTLALRSDSTVWVWGWNDRGQLGLGNTIDHNSPIQIPTDTLSGIIAISAGGYHSMALDADSMVWIWGANDQSQLGDGTNIDRGLPWRVSGLSGIVAISAGGYFSMALDADGHVWAWGENDNGQIGDGNSPQIRSMPFMLGIDSVLSISAGERHVLALRSNGNVWTWGANGNGQLGLADLIDRHSPDTVLNVSGIIAVAAGGKHSLILRQNGAVLASGLNGVGQLGLGFTGSRSSFSQILGFNATAIACGENHSMAITSDGSCWAWGSNFSGQVGNGTLIDQWTPTPVLGLCPTVFAAVDNTQNSYFQPTNNLPNHWKAGELASSIRLMDGRMIWVFGKSYVDNLLPNNSIPCSNAIANCLLVQDSLNSATFITKLDTAHPSRAYFRTRTPNASHFVPGHGYQDHPDAVTIFLSEYAEDSTFLGTWAAKVGIVTMTVLDISRVITGNTTIDFGTAVIADTSADLLYLYGSRKDSADHIFPYLSRRILSDTAAAWEFATPAGWSTQIADARPISRFPISRQYSVTSLQGHHYLITQNPEPNTTQCELQRNILAYRSDDLKGPFDDGSFLATSQDSVYNFPVFAFNAYAHPDQHAFGFTRCDSILVSYNLRDIKSVPNGCLSQCATQGSQDADSWRPHFLRIPYSLIDTTLSTATVASFTSSHVGMTWTFVNTSQFATTFFWNFGDGHTDTVPNPTHTFQGSLPPNVTLTVSGCGSTQTSSVPLAQQDPHAGNAPRFRVFPQPSRGPIHIQGEHLGHGPLRFELYTLQGEVIAQQTHSATNGHFETVLECNPPAGMYLLRIASSQSSTYLRIVVL